MSYAALISLARTLLQIQKHDQYHLFLNQKRRIKSLHKNVIFLQEFLEESPERAKSFEARIKDVANEAEDIVEYVLFEQMPSLNSRRGSHQSGRSASRIDQHNLQKRYKKLPKVIEDFESIVEKVMETKYSRKIKDLQLSDCSPSNSSPSPSVPVHTKKDVMVGFEDDLMTIKTRICGESRKLGIIPIYGMGGIGKTTLARNAYYDPLIMEHFYIRAWVTVSQDYSIPEMLFSLVHSIKAFNEFFDKEIHSYELMAEHVYKTLKGSKYLIVLDDIWSTKAWDHVKRLFPDDNNGSRIILTTRLSDVAACADSSSPLHEMHFMDVSQSWNLLRQKVFGQSHCPSELEKTGKEIAKSCRGLPLAIVVVAGLLSTVSPTTNSWQDIAENVNLAVTANDDQFSKILSLSYTHLPHHLRPCFLYMAGFPEDYEIHVSKLIKLWVAEGFLKRTNGSRCFEEGAEQYLEDLVTRSLILVNKRKSNGKIRTCSVHDLVRDLCVRKAQEEKFLLCVMDKYVDKLHPKTMKDQRRLSIFHSSLVPILSNIYDPFIRTVFFFHSCQTLFGSSKKFRLLKVLDVVKHVISKFPTEVLELIYLKYISLTCMRRCSFDIPASIVRLQNLQTFFICPYNRIWSSKSRIRFPSEIWGMTQLRHLGFFVLDPLPDPCSRSFALQNLQTLAMVINFKCTERIVKMIPNLKKLEISYDGDGITCGVYQLHNLVHLHQLEDLKICAFMLEPVRLWEKLDFPMMLKKLSLKGCSLKWRDMAMIGSSPNLEVLKFTMCSYQDGKWETTEGEFPRLKFLQIISTNLEEWITESSHFPSLKHLRLCFCDCLVEIPSVIGDIPTLELIEVNVSGGSLVESAEHIKEEQESLGNDSLQVRFADGYW